jgi:hypothetical protein
MSRCVASAHHDAFANDVAQITAGAAVNPFRGMKDELWTCGEIYDDNQGGYGDGTLHLKERLAAHGLGLGSRTNYPGPTGMVGWKLEGTDEVFALGVGVSPSGLSIILVEPETHRVHAIAEWDLPMGDGLNAVNVTLDQIVADVAARCPPSNSPGTH